jgi:anti-sigma factor RsiW
MKDFPSDSAIDIRVYTVATQPIPDDQLTRYLLGLSSAEEAQRIDESSVADDAVAERLQTLEEELIEGYAAGTLSPETLQRFECFYLSSPHRRKKVAFVKGLHKVIDEPSDAPSVVAPPAVPPRRNRRRSSADFRRNSSLAPAY